MSQAVVILGSVSLKILCRWLVCNAACLLGIATAPVHLPNSCGMAYSRYAPRLITTLSRICSASQ